MLAPRVAQNSLRLASGGRCRVWPPRLSTRCDKPGQSLPDGKRLRACGRQECQARSLSFSSSLRVRAPSRTTTTMAISKAIPRRCRTPRATGRADYPPERTVQPCNPLIRISLKELAPRGCGGQVRPPHHPTASRQSAVSKMAVSQCSEATCCGPLRSI